MANENITPANIDDFKKKLKEQDNRENRRNWLKKDEIPLMARILSVADAFDSLASTRTYREKVEEEEILKIMRDSSGTQFDPTIVDAFFKAHQKFSSIGRSMRKPRSINQ